MIKFIIIIIKSMSQILPKLLLAKITEALAAKLVGDVPGDKSGMTSCYLRQFSVNRSYFVSEDF